MRLESGMGMNDQRPQVSLGTSPMRLIEWKNLLSSCALLACAPCFRGLKFLFMNCVAEHTSS